MIGRRDLETLEDDQEHEQVIEAQAPFDEVSREIFLHGLATENAPHQGGKAQADSDPESAPVERVRWRLRSAVADQVDGK